MKRTLIWPTLDVIGEALDAAVWHKSTYSGTQGNCVEIARNLPQFVLVRDSADPNGPKLLVSPGEWQSFIEQLKAADS